MVCLITKYGYNKLLLFKDEGKYIIVTEIKKWFMMSNKGLICLVSYGDIPVFTAKY